MFLRIMAVLLSLIGLAGVGIAFLALQISAPAQMAAAPPPPPPPTKMSILIAARPQRAGNLMTGEDITATEVLVGQQPAGSFTDSVSARTALRGAMVRRSLAANEPILASDVLNPGDRGFLAAVLGSGMRAVSVGVDSVSGTAGLIWPGDHVDLVLTQSIDDKDQPFDRRVSGETVLTNLRVIAVDQQLVQGGQGGAPTPAGAGNSSRTVTIEASSFDAERIAVASRLGRISLVIRSAADNQTTAGAMPGTAGAGTAGAGTAAGAPPDAAPIAWAGDVSPALRDHNSGRNGVSIRLYHGPANMDEVRF